jgi:anti-sigma B factor antagonist
MPQMAITMDVRHVSERASVVDIKGDITAGCEQVLMDAYTQVNSAGSRAIILNFSGLTYMNSGGIGLLVTLLVRANRHGQRLVAFGLNEHYREIFSLTRLDEAIVIAETEREALTATGAAPDEKERPR